jgi:hypothetical protein
VNHKIRNGEIHIRSTNKECFGRCIFALDHPYHYESNDKELVVDVPKDFETDFASVPFLFWIFFPPIYKWQKAAIVHDYLYRTGKKNRKIADSVFLKEIKLAPIRMFIIWLNIRFFGWLFYHKTTYTSEVDRQQ